MECGGSTPLCWGAPSNPQRPTSSLAQQRRRRVPGDTGQETGDRRQRLGDRHRKNNRRPLEQGPKARSIPAWGNAPGKCAQRVKIRAESPRHHWQKNGRQKNEEVKNRSAPAARRWRSDRPGAYFEVLPHNCALNPSGQRRPAQKKSNKRSQHSARDIHLRAGQ